ncbi:hypothetical protein N0V93_002795 [Gnomoniopsis smithogilvyi]|uniref:Uncharacterized protein n=1 Tax=Gnomoniopsis smithogilvyi TaxID=1191159 RepID=A0A9W9CZA3_9PEZI|nr:hypothetical protein N0V93_002795 [Gnomoniopsis smithogilvyi]
MANNGSNTSSTWFPVGKDNWQLDAVTLLAVIGEASVSDNAQPMTASMLCLLPRILPAPQALLKPTRPTRLPAYKAQMVGVQSGVSLDSVGFFANIIHPLEERPAYSFHVYEIRHNDGCDDAQHRKGGKKGRTWSARLLPRSTDEKKIPRQTKTKNDANSCSENEAAEWSEGRGVVFGDADIEKGRHFQPSDPTPGLLRRRTFGEKMTDFVANPTSLGPQKRPAVPPALGSPIHIITIFSFLLTLVIFGLTAYWKDGNALIATFIISLQASLVGYASWWKPRVMIRPHANSAVPPGDVMIRTREGAFILVKCTEDVARELYTGTEECEYHVGPMGYRICMAIGTMLLMIGVVLLGNTSFNAQALISGSYIVLNGAYWLLGLLPKDQFWDLSRYEWKEVTPKDAEEANKNGDPSQGVEASASFTRTLWFAIRETRSTGWVTRSGAAPGTPQWRQWLKEASENANAGNRRWAAVARKDAIMSQGVTGEPKTDDAEQRAPLTEVSLVISTPAPGTGSL